MGHLISAVKDLNPITPVSDAVKAAVHDVSVYVLNDGTSDCNFCGCWVFAFRSKETHDDNNKTDDNTLNVSWT